MGFFDFLKQANINQGIEEYKKTAGAVLLDVRTPQEYQEGHIPESKNVPLQQLNNVVSVVKNTEIPLFVYCYSGARSRQATGMLQRMGYASGSFKHSNFCMFIQSSYSCCSCSSSGYTAYDYYLHLIFPPFLNNQQCHRYYLL